MRHEGDFWIVTPVMQVVTGWTGGWEGPLPFTVLFNEYTCLLFQYSYIILKANAALPPPGWAILIIPDKGDDH